MSFGGGVVSSAGLRCRLRVKGWVPQKTLATIGEGLGKPEKPPSSSSGKQSWGRCGGCGGSGVGVEVGEDEGEAFSSSCREGDNNRKRGRRGEERSGSPPPLLGLRLWTLSAASRALVLVSAEGGSDSGGGAFERALPVWECWGEKKRGG